ncbi:hypothetical protein SSX86_028381 [Deinandra increscens subsp. villosa]|uniref:Uncharacterized protein n=1 Tax=Deinandra increscens subsp. villosa TaxID=3103831 RepID=A0AAP0CAQ4_9ASTR
MAEIAAADSPTNERRCKRSDGRGWRCRQQAAEGKGYCERHLQQAILRQKRQPVPDYLKLERARRTPIIPKLEPDSDGGVTGGVTAGVSGGFTDEVSGGITGGVTDAPVRQRRKRKMKEVPEDVSGGVTAGVSGGITDEISDGVSGGVTDAPVRQRRKRKMKEVPEDVSVVPRKRAKKVKKEDSGQLKSGKVSDNLNMGRYEISPPKASTSSQRKASSPAIKIGVTRTGSGLRRPIRSKNIEPIPVATVKFLPSIKQNVKASAKKKIVKRCHWCRLTSFCSLVKCSTCKKNFFCEECINRRFYCKKTVERECPVCQGECSCRACTRGKPKQVKTKEPAIYDLEQEVVICDPEKEMTVVISEKKSTFDTSQHLHMIRELLPLMTKMNQEKIIELDTEAKNKGIRHEGVHVHITGYTQKECSFCKACISDVHRTCDHCSFSLCLVCCHDIHDGYLHSSLENLKKTKMIRSKSSKSKSWRFCLDGSIRCPPKNVGGCDGGPLQLASFYPFCFTKDLEENAKQILCNFQLKKSDWLSDSSPCLLCEENGEAGLYFSTKQEFKEDNLEHFTKHWGEGQPIVIRDVFQNQADLNWDFGFMFCEYLEKSAESLNNTEIRSSKSTRDWCKYKFGREQILCGGITRENVWNEFLTFKLWFSLDFFQDHFPDHYNAVIQSLPVQQYMNPFTGFLNLGAFSPHRTKNPNLGSSVSISYGGSDNSMDVDRLSNLCVHTYDVVNILVHATSHPISERTLNDVKMLLNKYNSRDHLMSSKKIAKRNKLEEMFASSSRLDDTRNDEVDLTSLRLGDTPNHEVVLVSDESESESESDDEHFSEHVNSCGAHWDIFRREDVPMLLQYLRKYSDKFSRSHGSAKMVVHPLFDDMCYLDDYHKTRLKEEFNVDALSLEQNIGEAVIIPAGCPYQMKKITSCVNVVYEFMSPESALESIKVSDEVRLLPVNHKAKGTMMPVREMAINRMKGAIEELREVKYSMLKECIEPAVKRLTKAATCMTVMSMLMGQFNGVGIGGPAHRIWRSWLSCNNFVPTMEM